MSARATTAEQIRAVLLADVLTEEQRLKVAEDVHRAALAQLTVEATAIREEHAAAAAAARAEFAAAPPAPDLPDGQGHRDALYEVMRARDVLAARRTEALAAGLPAIVQGWDSARPSLDEQARQLAAQARQLAESYASWHRLLYEARRSAEQPTRDRGRIRNGPSERMRPRPGPHDVLDAALGADLCGVGPTDSAVRAMLVSGLLSDGSNRVMVDRS